MVAGTWSGGQGQGPDSDPWSGKVVIGRSGGRSFAYRPDRLLVARGPWQRLVEATRDNLLGSLGGDTPAVEQQGDPRGPVVLTGVTDPVTALRLVRDEGLVVQYDHVFFGAPDEGADVGGAPVMFGGVGGAPVMFGGVGGAPVMFGGVGGAPVMFGGVGGAPVMFGGVGGAPVMFGGVGGAPVMFGGVGGAPVMFGGAGAGMCGYCRLDVGPPPGSPPAPRRSTVRSAAEPAPPRGDGTCRVVVVDTGLAAKPFLPDDVRAQAVGMGTRDEPDADDDGNLDAASGHALFIAAIIEQLAPGATVEVRQVLSTFGDGSDSEVGDALWALVDERPDVVNLSFAGYSDNDTAPLAIRDAIAQLVAGGTAVVAAAGNDATCRPAWPASLDGVVGVAALGPGGPAWFTNHGPWVRACAPGVDVVSRFFRVPIQPAMHATDIDALGEIVEWATWSGTSFAAPIVAGALARAVLAGWAPVQAVARTIDNPSLMRLAGLGTVFNERPW